MTEIDDYMLQMAARHVQEAEERIADQVGRIARLDHAGHHDAAEIGRSFLATLTRTLNVARWHFELERRHRE